MSAIGNIFDVEKRENIAGNFGVNFADSIDKTGRL